MLLKEFRTMLFLSQVSTEVLRFNIEHSTWQSTVGQRFWSARLDSLEAALLWDARKKRSRK